MKLITVLALMLVMTATPTFAANSGGDHREVQKESDCNGEKYRKNFDSEGNTFASKHECKAYVNANKPRHNNG